MLESQLGTLRGEHAGTAAEYSSVEKERDELFNSFEASVKQVQQKTDFRNIVLDQKLGNMASSLENAEVQVKQIVAAANLDPVEAERVQASLDSTLNARNQQIKDLRFALVRVTKSYNDSLRSFMQKLEDLGIPTTEVDAMGFVPIPTSASNMGPAGLVVRRAGAERSAQKPASRCGLRVRITGDAELSGGAGRGGRRRRRRQRRMGRQPEQAAMTSESPARPCPILARGVGDDARARRLPLDRFCERALRAVRVVQTSANATARRRSSRLALRRSVCASRLVAGRREVRARSATIEGSSEVA